MSLTGFAARLTQRCHAAKKEHHEQMDTGVDRDQYHRLVGRNNQLNEVREWIAEELKRMGEEDDDDHRI